MEEHINNLKINFNGVLNGSDNISVCEEDFEVSDNESGTSETILKNFEFNNSNVQESTFIDMQDKGETADSVNGITNHNSQSTYCETQNSNLTSIEKMVDENTYISLSQNNTLKVTPIVDSEATEIYTVYAFTDKHTHVSQSQDNLVISDKYFISKSDATRNCERTLDVEDINFEVNNNVKLAVDVDLNNKLQDTYEMVINNNDKAMESNINKNFSQNSIELFDENVKNMNNSQIVTTENANIINNVTAASLDLSFIDKTSKKIERKVSKNTQFPQNSYSFDEFEYFTDTSQHFTSNSSSNVGDKDNKGFSQVNNLENRQDKPKVIVINDGNTDSFKAKISKEKFNLKKDDFEDDIEFISKETYDMRDVTESQIDVVTFKVLEELSNVKNYLNRRERSGERYRSSQYDVFIYASGSSAAPACSVNESARCLLRHVTSSALLSRTVHITSHVSKVLGDLIDNLHEEEKYPNFLEDLLETVDNLLQYIHTGDNCEENIILKKEQAINRLLLLNRSIHIIGYSIQKITSILQDTIQYIKMDDFEINHPDTAENICHIFHILEILLHRHTYKHTQNKSQTQSSQSSQETLRKSALTETWRRKWSGGETLGGMEVKEEKLRDNKGCGGERVLKECSKVLRSFLVDAMDGFGLLAFSALNCYNILQN